VIVRRLLIAVAVLLAATAFAVASDPDRAVRDGDDRPAAAAPSPTATSTPTASTDAASPAERDTPASGDPPLRTLRAEDAGQIVRVRPGERVRLRVVSDGLETVQLGEDGPIEVVDPDSPAEFEILAEQGLDADVRLLESGRTIGRVTTEG